MLVQHLNHVVGLLELGLGLGLGLGLVRVRVRVRVLRAEVVVLVRALDVRLVPFGQPQRLPSAAGDECNMQINQRVLVSP